MMGEAKGEGGGGDKNAVVMRGLGFVFLLSKQAQTIASFTLSSTPRPCLSI